MIKGRAFFDDRPGLCDIAAVLCVAICVCALLNIGAISFQQFVQICRHDLYRTIFNVRDNILLCVAFWLVGLLVAIPSFTGWTENIYDPKMLECIWDRTHSMSYTVFYVCVAVFLPLVIISYSYTRIFLHVRASKRRIQKIIQVSNTNPPNGTTPQVNKPIFYFGLLVAMASIISDTSGTSLSLEHYNVYNIFAALWC